MSECTRLPEGLLEDMNRHIYKNPSRCLLLTRLRFLIPAMARSRRKHSNFYLLSLLYNLTIALLLSFTYFQLAKNVDTRTRALSILSALFTMRVALLILTVNTTQDVFVYDRKTVLWNRHFEYGFPAWMVYSCRFLISIPFRVLIVLLISLIMYPIIGLRGGVDRFLVFFLALCLQEIAAVALGMANGACCDSPTLRATMGAMLVAFNILFGGAVFVADSVSWVLRWMQFLAILYYSSIMIARNEIDDRSPVFDLVTKNDLHLLSIWAAMGCLLGIAALLFAIGCIGLTVTTSHNIKSRTKTLASR